MKQEKDFMAEDIPDIFISEEEYKEIKAIFDEIDNRSVIINPPNFKRFVKARKLLLEIIAPFNGYIEDYNDPRGLDATITATSGFPFIGCPNGTMDIYRKLFDIVDDFKVHNYATKNGKVTLAVTVKDVWVEIST